MHNSFENKPIERSTAAPVLGFFAPLFTIRYSLFTICCTLYAVLYTLSTVSSVRAQNSIEMGTSGDFAVYGTAGTLLDPDFKVKGFSVFGSTQAAYTGMTLDNGNVVINGYLAVSSGAYFVGPSTFSSNLYISGSSTTFTNAGNIFIAGGAVDNLLTKAAGGGLKWTNLSALGGDDLGDHVATTTLNMGNFGIVSVATVAIDGGALGAGAGSSLKMLTLRSLEGGNNDYLVFSSTRAATGADWTGAKYMINRLVDVTNMGYIRFGDPGSDLLTFGEDQSEYMRLDDAGRLGIGRSVPARKLDVLTATSGDGARVYNSAGDARVNLSTSAGFAGWSWANNWSNFQGFSLIEEGVGGNVIFVKKGGNVGIWTPNPKAVLDVEGPIQFGSGANKSTFTATGEIIARDEITGTLGAGYAQFRAVGGNTGAMLRNDGSNTYMLLTNSGNPYGQWNGFRPFYIDNSDGDLTMSSNVFVGGQIYMTHPSSRTIFFGNAGLGAPGNGSAGEKIQLWGVTSGAVRSDDSALGIESGNMWFNTGGGIKWYLASSLAASMDSAGKIAIGNAAPASKVTVINGELQVGTSGTACTSSNAGAIRYTGGSFIQFCAGNRWLSLSSSTLQSPVYLNALGAGTWTVPLDWNSSSNTIEVIGGGGGSSYGGGGGGGYSKASNVALTPGGSVGYTVGAGGGAPGGSTWFCNSTSNCTTYNAAAVVVSATGGTGGDTSGTGLTAAGGSPVIGSGYSGGTGTGNTGSWSYGAGGGAGGPNGAGKNGGTGVSSWYTGAGGGGASGGSAGNSPTSSTTGGAGGNNYLGSGGGAGGVSASGSPGTNGGGGGGTGNAGYYGGVGGNGTAANLAGGGGGVGWWGAAYGGNGGYYGGGAGGANAYGAQGVVIIQWWP